MIDDVTRRPTSLATRQTRHPTRSNFNCGNDVRHLAIDRPMSTSKHASKVHLNTSLHTTQPTNQHQRQTLGRSVGRMLWLLLRRSSSARAELKDGGVNKDRTTPYHDNTIAHFTRKLSDFGYNCYHDRHG